ncbi:SpaA isopeptide-forming pilin-related protein [Kitasatospora viridis]|uniref:LPXTG-motif cell wall-anchored protein n=1 Tax=Kitasatospora viridis TaxID=281105 RepID=A0A561SEI0_9ACTN|nr:SpaA isopeptide-forming pilin-related protein [Kitasatospora viridis]TWF73272.1 LPXTG-motif cell wall-anchored protein [Kitasatospora viridis]
MFDIPRPFGARPPRGGPPKRRRRLAAAGTVLTLAAGYLGALVHTAEAQAGDGSVTVRVIRAVTASGVWQGAALEPGMSGVTVNLTDDAGTTISGTTAADGTVTLNAGTSGLTGGTYRVQVINPKPGVLFSAFASRQGLAGAPNQLSSTEEFVNLAGGRNVSYTTGLWNPGDYCQDNAPLVTACIRSDVTPADTGTRTLVSFPYHARGNDNQTTNLATRTDTGSVYGIGYSKQRRWIFSGATAHRGSAYGPGGSGGIYLTDRATNTTTLFATVPDTGTSAHDFTTDMDLAFAPAVAKEALGDVDVSEDGQDLYAVNLADRQLYRYDATQRTATAPRAVYPIPGPTTACPAAGDWRPYGLGIQDGVVYVGGVCSGESTQSVSDMRAIVRTFDPVAGTFGPVILDQPLDYPRLASFSIAPCPGAGWFPWSDTIPTTQNGTACGTTYYANPEPMLSDIEVDTDGSLILSFRDRLTDQIGQGQRARAKGGLFVPASGGALTKACAGANGMFVMAENLGCGKTGNRGQNYYAQQRTTYHNNAMYSGIALSKVESTIASSAVDPDGVTTYTGGTGFVNRDGSTSTTAQMGNRLTTAFGKGGSMADLEVMCDEAPLQIGNRVWYDVNRNGIQDPGENPVVGATVRLYDANNTVVGTMRTTARGEYYFDNSNVTGGLLPHTRYTIRVDLPADYAPGGPLYRWTVTQANAGTNRFVDNKGVVPPGGTYPEIAITTGGPGENNHTYDFGYYQPTGNVSITKTDPQGNPLAGATFQLWRKTNGNPGLQTTGPNADATVGAPCTTGNDGRCTANVGLGTYYWQETQAPNGFELPNPAVFGPLDLTMANYQAGVSTTAIDQPMTGQVTVTKADPQGNPLPGAVFQLWKKTNGGTGLQTTGPNPDTMVGTPCTTGNDGRCSATVGLGTYYWQETQAPNGYLLPDPAVFGPLVLTAANHQAGVSVVANDQPITGRVSVIKSDPQGNPLAGAVFQLYKEDGTAVGQPCTTGADGTCSATVGLGSYYWQETQAPAGYLLPNPARSTLMVLTAANYQAGVTVTAVDQPMTGTVKVLKVDPQGNPLAGAVFQLQGQDHSPIGQPCTTGADGICSAVVRLGTYYWQETQAPAGYQLPEPAVFGPLVLTAANYQQGVSTTATNRPAPGAVSVLKTDPQGNPLAGAVFQLQDQNHSPIGQPCTTPASGICSATVDPGTYYWQETQAPAGYELPDPAVFGPLVLTVQNSHQGVSVTAVDQPMTGQVSVLKTDPQGNPLAGAVFQLLGHDHAPIGSPCTTGTDGRCSATVGLGTYYWQETQAPNGYELPDPAVFGPLTLTSDNHRQGVSVTAVDQPMTGQVSVTKVDPEGRPLAGAVFQLLDQNRAPIGQPCTTGTDGRCSATVGLGTYYWEETAAPGGYLLPTPSVFGPLVLTPANHRQGVTVTVTDQPMTGQVTVLKTDQQGKPLAGAVFQLLKADRSPIGQPCTTGADGKCSATVGLGSYYWQETQAPDGYQLPDPAVFGPLVLTSDNHQAGVSTTAVDQPKPGAVTVRKTDPQGKPLAGAVFLLLDQNHNPVGSPCTTGADGKCTATVELGTYYWQESKAPDGYQLPSPALFGPLVLTLQNAAQGVSVTAVDQPMTGRVTVLKTDPQGKPLAGAVFQLLKADGTPVGGPCTTVGDGTCSATVGLGTYYWQETKAPDGYQLPSPAKFGPLTLTADNAQAGVRVTVVDKHEPELPKTGSSTLPVGLLSALLLVGGGGLVLIGRRIRRNRKA